MSKLTADSRKKLPRSALAGPDHSYPVPDKTHARIAKAHAPQAVNANRMQETKKDINDVKFDKVLRKKRAS
jgi:hypothetical protein